MGTTHAYFPGDPLPYHYKYEHMAVTTDCVIFTYEDWKLKVLLVRRGGEPCKGMWAFPGGFLRNDEDAGTGALRELREKTALEPSAPLVQLGVFSDPDRDPRERVLTIAWYALVKPSQVVGGDDAEEAAWFATDDLPPLAFDHAQIFDAAMERLRRDIHFQPVGFDLLDEEFTLPDLQRLYEAILGTSFDRRNFQRKILASGILDEAAGEETLFLAENPCLIYPGNEKRMPEPLPMAEAAGPQRQKKGRPGRTGTHYRLNRQRYELMKEDGNKQEF
ncbi:MAG: NUDIX hydrolase [Bacteroidales bacterium]|nr:NUDIX hydrolase [Bacteroidales bacterium]